MKSRLTLLLLVPLVCPGSARAGFTDVTDLYGVASGDSMSYGASFVDYDGDGDLDFYVNNHWRGPADFYRNDGAPPFLEFSDHFGPDNADRHDNLWGDFDNNGSPDQYIVRGRTQTNDLYWNRGGGIFEEGAFEAGVANLAGRSRELTLADFDVDGDLDIFLVNDFRAGFPKPSRMFINLGDGTFTQVANDDTMFAARLHISSADYDDDGDPDVVITNPPYANGSLWRNDGSLQFTEILTTAFPGISNPLLQANGLSWADYDNDGDLDLLTCSGNRAMWDYVALEADSLRWYAECEPGDQKSVHLVTEGDSVTVVVGSGEYAPVDLYWGSSGATDKVDDLPRTFAVADIAGTPPDLLAGMAGVFLWSAPATVGDSVHVVATQSPTGSGDLWLGGWIRANGPGISAWVSANHDPRPGFSLGDFTNRLYRNEGDGTFTEAVSPFDVNDPAVSSLAAAWGDYDNDGWIDVYVTNSGNVETGNAPNHLFRNNGDGTFTDVAAAEGVPGSDRGLGDGCLWGDFDADGALDLFVDNGAEHPLFGVGPRELLKGTPNSNHWLQMEMRGLDSNGMGIGAKVRVVSASGEQWRWALGDGDNCFSSAPTLHFGLGTDALIDTLQIFWPSGNVDTRTFVGVDRRVWAIEGKPLRNFANPHLIVLDDFYDAGTLFVGQTASSAGHRLDNFGGLATTFSVRYEDCAGNSIDWLSASPDTGGVWPAGGTEVEVFVDTALMSSPGDQCGRVIFESSSFLGPDTLTVNVRLDSTAVDVDPGLSGRPTQLALGVPRPNPTRGETTLNLSLPADGPVRAAVYDIAGRRVADLLDRPLRAGVHPLRWAGTADGGGRVAAGVYLLRAGTPQGVVQRKIVILD